MQCTRETHLRAIVERTEQQVIVEGVTNGGRWRMTLWANDKGQWTVMAADANGLACLLGSGTALQPVAPAPSGELH